MREWGGTPGRRSSRPGERPPAAGGGPGGRGPPKGLERKLKFRLEVSSSSSWGISPAKRESRLWLVVPKIIRLSAWERYSSSLARVMAT